jgi:hypothetical protein
MKTKIKVLSQPTPEKAVAKRKPAVRKPAVKATKPPIQVTSDLQASKTEATNNDEKATAENENIEETNKLDKKN